jgi:NADH-quinone oxidoreductase subunit F
VYQSLGEALQRPPNQIVAAIEESGLRGRGGAGFPTGRKWRTCAEAPGDRKYIIANGDEGDPGSFIDRELMERDPHSILEGMILAAYAVGASEGIVFVRSEYPRPFASCEWRWKCAKAGLLGPAVGGHAFGLMSASLPAWQLSAAKRPRCNAIEGKRGEARPRRLSAVRVVEADSRQQCQKPGECAVDRAKRHEFPRVGTAYARDKAFA